MTSSRHTDYSSVAHHQQLVDPGAIHLLEGVHSSLSGLMSFMFSRGSMTSTTLVDAHSSRGTSLIRFRLIRPTVFFAIDESQDKDYKPGVIQSQRNPHRPAQRKLLSNHNLGPFLLQQIINSMQVANVKSIRHTSSVLEK